MLVGWASVWAQLAQSQRQESELLKAESQEMPLPKFLLRAIVGSCAGKDLGLQISKPALADLGRTS